MALTPLSEVLAYQGQGFNQKLNFLRETSQRIQKNRDYVKQLESKKDLIEYEMGMQRNQAEWEYGKRKEIAKIEQETQIGKKFLDEQTEQIQNQQEAQLDYLKELETQRKDKQKEVYEIFKTNFKTALEIDGVITPQYEFKKNENGEVVEAGYKVSIEDDTLYSLEQAQEIYSSYADAGEIINEFQKVSESLQDETTRSTEGAVKFVGREEAKNYMEEIRKGSIIGLEYAKEYKNGNWTFNVGEKQDRQRQVDAIQIKQSAMLNKNTLINREEEFKFLLETSPVSTIRNRLATYIQENKEDSPDDAQLAQALLKDMNDMVIKYAQATGKTIDLDKTMFDWSSGSTMYQSYLKPLEEQQNKATKAGVDLAS